MPPTWPADLIVVWGALVAPKTRWPPRIPTRVVIELTLFGAAAVALAVAGQPLLAIALGDVAVANLAAQRLAGASSQSRQTSPVDDLAHKTAAWAVPSMGYPRTRGPRSGVPTPAG